MPMLPLPGCCSSSFRCLALARCIRFFLDLDMVAAAAAVADAVAAERMGAWEISELAIFWFVRVFLKFTGVSKI
jgi:hypothetical protein